jgi:thiamine pyrophosphokinase
MSRKKAIIFANGSLPQPSLVRKAIRKGDFIIAADGGMHHLLNLDVRPDLVIGDLDSLETRTIRLIKKQQIEIIQHPVDKDETDLELAINEAVKRKHREVLVIAATGGRLDQILANILLLVKVSDPMKIQFSNGNEEVFVIHRHAVLRGQSGETVSLIPVNGTAGGITTSGLKYLLKNEDLEPGSTRGISNEMLGTLAQVRLRKGKLLCIHLRNSGEKK